MKKLGGTVDDTEGFEGLVFAQKVAKVAGGPSRVEKAKIAVLQASTRTDPTALPSRRILLFSSVVFFMSCHDLAMNPNCPLLQFCLSPPKVQPHPQSHRHLPFASPSPTYPYPSPCSSLHSSYYDCCNLIWAYITSACIERGASASAFSRAVPMRLTHSHTLQRAYSAAAGDV